MEFLISGFLFALLFVFGPFAVSLGAGRGSTPWKVATFVLCLITGFGFGFPLLFIAWLVAWITAVAAYSAARRERFQQALIEAVAMRKADQ